MHLFMESPAASASAAGGWGGEWYVNSLCLETSLVPVLTRDMGLFLLDPPPPRVSVGTKDAFRTRESRATLWLVGPRDLLTPVRPQEP